MDDFVEVKPLAPHKKPSHQFCICPMGGLGDTIKKYFGAGRHGDGWEYLTSLKQKYPDSVVKLVTLCANDQAAKHYLHHPHIDCIIKVRGPTEDGRIQRDTKR